MSQDSEARSPASLAPAAEILIPSTPPRRSILSASPELKAVRDRNGSLSDKNGGFCSPHHASSSEMTPPPSSQTRAPIRRSRSGSGSHMVVPASPPPHESLETSLYAAYGTAENLPTTEDIDAADETQLRKIAKDLLGIAQEAPIKRAEVEQQLARREVEILQSSEYQNRRAASHSRTPQVCPSPLPDASLKKVSELERINARLEERLSNAKKLVQEKIDEGNTKNETLLEENRLLKKRIRDNREHLTMFLDAGSLSPSSRAEFSTPQRKSQPRPFDSARTQASIRDRFAELIAADRVLHGQSTNVSPVRHRPQRSGHQLGAAHVRGAHSMSSLPMTPQRHTYAHDRPQYSTPGSRSREPVDTGKLDSEHDRYDRDSTISASDAEEAVTDGDIPASHASSRATDMLRRLPELSQGPTSPQPNPANRHNLGKSSTLLQTKLFGHVRKAGVVRSDPTPLKRKGSFVEEETPALKKPKDVGLGITSWKLSSA